LAAQEEKIGEEEEDKEEENVLDGFRHGLRRIPDPIHVFRLEQGVTGRALVEQKRRHLLLLYVVLNSKGKNWALFFSLTSSLPINQSRSFSQLTSSAKCEREFSDIDGNSRSSYSQGLENLSNEWIACVPETRPNGERRLFVFGVIPPPLLLFLYKESENRFFFCFFFFFFFFFFFSFSSSS
jgi:hypothetical protein